MSCAAVAPIDFGKKLCEQFKDMATIRDAGQYQINKYAILHCMSKPSVSHPTKGQNGRGHVQNVLNRVDSLPAVKLLFDTNDSELVTQARDLCSSLPCILPGKPKSNSGTDVD